MFSLFYAETCGEKAAVVFVFFSIEAADGFLFLSLTIVSAPFPFHTRVSQHNKRREELHRLQEKHAHLAPKLEAAAAREAAAAVTRDP